MPRVIRGTLITCEPAIKSIILHIDAENNNEIVIEDLDDTHLFIKESKYDDLKRLLDLKLKDTLKVEAPLDDSD
ncbi:TFIIH subunit TTDA/Tfb5 [Podospora conica]|nr:TFIIH subunit TTDA/Tfb5 [Schizothecium conicum]